MTFAKSRWLGFLAASLLAGGTMLPTAATAGPELRHKLASKPVRCDGAIQHPLEVRAVALDPVRRGETVRIRVTTQSRNGIERGEVLLVSTGGATLASAPRVALKEVAPGGEATTQFAVTLPAEGKQFLLQFRVTGEGQNGVASRGATFNLLPDGPSVPNRVVTSGSRTIAEHRARRIEP